MLPVAKLALGPTDPAIDLPSLGQDLLLGPFDKTLFSMLVPDVRAILDTRPSVTSIVIFGIEVRSIAFNDGEPAYNISFYSHMFVSSRPSYPSSPFQRNTLSTSLPTVSPRATPSKYP